MAAFTWMAMCAATCAYVVLGTLLLPRESVKTLIQTGLSVLLAFGLGFSLEIFRTRTGTSHPKGPMPTTTIAPPPAFITRALLKRPGVAWPTVALSILAVAGFMLSIELGRRSHGVPAKIGTIGGATVFAFMSFTPMHDAAHGSVAPDSRWINTAVGYFSSLPFFGLYRIFRAIHLIHHKYTNDKNGAPDGSSLDPDHWAGEGPTMLLPLRWASVYLYYIYYLVQLQDWQKYYEFSCPVGAPLRPLFLEICVLFASSIAGIAWLKEDFVCLMLLPSILSATLLMYVFDYIPHRPHLIPRTENHFKATHVALPPFGMSESYFTGAMLFQNYHNIHHLFPFLPFYCYSRVWKAHRKDFLRNGTREIPFFASNSVLS